MTAIRSHAALAPRRPQGITPPANSFQHVVQRLDRSGLLALPIQQSLRLPIPLIAGHRKVFHFASVGEQLPLPLAHADRGIPQGPGALRPIFFLRPVVQHVRAFPHCFAIFPVRLPLPFRQTLDVLSQVGRHTHADAENNGLLRSVRTLLVTQPLHQFLFPARRIAPKVILLHRRRQSLKRAPRHRQRIFLCGHVAIAELVRQD